MTERRDSQSEPNTFGPMNRRQFLASISLAAAGLSAALVGVPIVGFLVSPLLQKDPEVWRAVAKVNDLQVGETKEVVFSDPSPLPWAGVAADTAAWLRRTGPQDFVAFAINCTHLGCPVNWLPQANLFMCPCHGGVYNNDGTVAAGPPPEPLVKYPVRINGDQVEIRTSPLPITG